MRSDRPIRVVVIDDSASMRALIAHTLAADERILVVGEAADPFEARERIKALNPDVITLDVEMPRMNGLTFLENLMRLRPMPVIMVSTLTKERAPTTLAALELGALDVVPKPASSHELPNFTRTLIEKVRAAGRAVVRAPSAPRPAAPKTAPVAAFASEPGTIVAMGGSTGGTEAFREILAALPPGMPPIVIAQHIPAEFSGAFAARLDQVCALRVREAIDGVALEAGHVYVAPGGRQTRIRSACGVHRLAISDEGKINYHAPCVDELFASLVPIASSSYVVAGLLTGMGADGAASLLALRDAGAATFAQDEASSTVWGMPGEAVKRGAAGEVLPLSRIAGRIEALVQRPLRRSA